MTKLVIDKNIVLRQQKQLTELFMSHPDGVIIYQTTDDFITKSKETTATEKKSLVSRTNSEPIHSQLNNYRFDIKLCNQSFEQMVDLSAQELSNNHMEYVSAP